MVSIGASDVRHWGQEPQLAPYLCCRDSLCKQLLCFWFIDIPPHKASKQHKKEFNWEHPKSCQHCWNHGAVCGVMLWMLGGGCTLIVGVWIVERKEEYGNQEEHKHEGKRQGNAIKPLLVLKEVSDHRLHYQRVAIGGVPKFHVLTTVVVILHIFYFVIDACLQWIRRRRRTHSSFIRLCNGWLRKWKVLD